MLLFPRLQPSIAVIGSSRALDDSSVNDSLASDIGSELAGCQVRLIFGVEESPEHLPDLAYRSFVEGGGTALGVFRTHDDRRRCGYRKLIPIVAGQQRGAGWESVIVLSAQAVIAIGGGAGTLQEIAIAYQAGIPIVVLRNSGGWADAFVGRPVDYRKKDLILVADSPKEAVALAIAAAAWVENVLK